MASLLSQIRERGVGPTNYLRVFKPDTAIEGHYAIDLSMPPLLQSAYDGLLISKQNHNLLLESSKGSITAEIWIVPDPSGKSKRASMTLLSQSGSVKAKLHCPEGKKKDGPARPNLDVEICANNGDVSISLPRCFRGEITIRAAHDRIAFSTSLGACTAPLLDIPEERVYFVRDELCGAGGGGGGGTEQQQQQQRRRRRRTSHGEAQGSTSGGSGGKDDDDDRSGVREEESLDALLVHGEHRSVRINWDGEADLPERERKRTLGGIVIPSNLKLAGLKAVWNDVGKDVVKRFLTSARPN